MTQTYHSLREQLKCKLIPYLKTEKHPFYPPALTLCPCCGAQAVILGEELWCCTACKANGDLVDYAMAQKGFRSENETI